MLNILGISISSHAEMASPAMTSAWCAALARAENDNAGIAPDQLSFRATRPDIENICG